MRVLIAHNALSEDESDPSTLDVLVQALHVESALQRAGHVTDRFSFDRDLETVARKAREWRPDAVFNLVESLDGRASLHPVAAGVWELIGIPHTGSATHTLLCTTDKHLAKTLMKEAGILTPEWGVGDAASPPPWIVKPALEDASVGIEEDSVVRNPEHIADKVRSLQRAHPGQRVLVERFIEGREFNLSVIAGPDGPQVLPVAEMRFEDYPPGKERVLGFRSKWAPESFEYKHTKRRFDFPAADDALLQELETTARACWRLFDVNGYARVDTRVDAQGRVYVIEVNTNPCLSPDAGFAAALDRAGVSPVEMAQCILEDMVCVPKHPPLNLS